MLKKISFRTKCIGAAVAAAAAVLLYIGNTHIGTTYVTVDSENIPLAFNGFKIAHISDLHNAEFGEGQSKLIEKIREADPDIIVITGDMIDSRRTDVEKAVELVVGLGGEIPIYYVTGNHESRVSEYSELEEKLVENGVNVLRNKNQSIEIDGSYINIIGVDDPAFGYSSDEMYDTITGLKGDSYNILLSHRPELFGMYIQTGVDLVLSGHAHGGQVRIPFIGGLAAPNQGFFPKYTEGLYENGGTSMIVSRGLGNSIIPLRVNDPPELVIIMLKSGV